MTARNRRPIRLRILIRRFLRLQTLLYYTDSDASAHHGAHRTPFAKLHVSQHLELGHGAGSNCSAKLEPPVQLFSCTALGVTDQKEWIQRVLYTKGKLAVVQELSLLMSRQSTATYSTVPARCFGTTRGCPCRPWSSVSVAKNALSLFIAPFAASTTSRGLS